MCYFIKAKKLLTKFTFQDLKTNKIYFSENYSFSSCSSIRGLQTKPISGAH